MSRNLAVANAAPLSTIEARETINAERRYLLAKTYVEPIIKIASNDPTAEELLPNHIFQLRNPATTKITVKCRKIAHSWGISLNALLRAVTEPRSTSIIGSYDEDEAREKLNYLDWIYKSVCDANPSFLDEWGMSDGMEIRRFNNGSRIRFISRKAPVGPGAAIDWDEFSVEPPGRVTASEILAGALGCITHTGTVSLGGTQRGPDTVFNKIVSGELARQLKDNPLFANISVPTWTVGRFPWWTSPALCSPKGNFATREEKMAATAVHLASAARYAPNLSTAERVERYGNEKLQYQFGYYCTTPELGFEIFQREFEMLVLDDKESYFEDDLLNFGYEISGPNYVFYHAIGEGAKYGQFGDALEKCKREVDKLSNDIRARKFTGQWGFAMDVGADRDPSEIWIGCAPQNDREMLEPRLNIAMHQMPFDGQEEMVDYIMKKIPISRGAIDATKGSLSVMLAQRLNRKYGAKVEPYPFTQDSKTVLATGTKARLQAGKLAFPPRSKNFEKLHNQTKRVKREDSGKTVRFDAARNKTDHADSFWTLALLCEVFATPLTRRPRRGVALRQNAPTVHNPFSRSGPRPLTRR